VKSCIVHLGLHKTGSTGLQHWLATNRQALLTKGVLVPAAGGIRPEVAAHHNIAFQVNHDARFSPDKGGLEQLLSDLKQTTCEMAVISSEEFAFSAAQLARTTRLREAICSAGFRPRWLVYLRSLPAWLNSAYCEMVKDLRIEQRFGPWCKARGHTMLGFRAKEIVEALFTTGDRVDIRSYSIASGRGIATDFLETIGLSLESFGASEAPRVNRRSPLLWVELQRMLGRVLAANQFSQEGAAAVSVRAKKALPLLPKSDPYCGMSDDLAAEIEREIERPYTDILRMSGFPGQYADFFPRQSFRKNEYDPREASREQAQGLSRVFMQTIMDRLP